MKGALQELVPPADAPAEDGKAPSRMAEVAYAEMRRRILGNAWPPGFQATEQELATELGMSRTPVREALLRLQQEGIVTVVSRHGMRVLPVSEADMREIYEVLTSLEATAAELAAARRLDEAELLQLERATAAMDAALRADDLDAWAQADKVFHDRLLDLSGNKLLKTMVSNILDRAHRVRMLTLKMRPKPVNSTRDHIALVEAIRAGEPERASQIHRDHRRRAGDELLHLLRQFGFKQL